MRKLILVALAFLAARMAARAVRREAEVIGLLWTLVQAIAVAGTPNTAKTRAVEARVAALAPRTNTLETNVGTLNTAVTNIPPNHAFLSTLSTASTGSVGTGAAAGSVPGVSANAAGTVPSVNAAVSGNPTTNPPSQGYVTALAGNLNDLRADVISQAFYVDALRTGCVNALRSDVISLRNYVSAFAGTYNQTVSAVSHIQDQLNAHGFSST